MAKAAKESKGDVEARPDGAEGPQRQQRTSVRVLAIRHGVADDRADYAKEGRSDAARPLTQRGVRKMRRASRGLERVQPSIDIIASSPLARAAETAEIVAKRYPRTRVVRVSHLAPGKSASALLGWVREQKPGATVAIVGHEPDLGQFVSWALTGLRDSFAPLKKGAACLIEFADEVKPGRGRLLWCLKPSQLRALGR